MRIGYISAVFPPEPEPASVMASELVRAWAGAGHDVFVVCPFPNRPHGVVYSGFKRRLWSIQSFEQARCVRVWSWLIGKERRPVNRILENVTFGFSSALAVLLHHRPDVVVLDTWPVLAAALAVAACAARGIKVINYVQDIYPEAAIAAGFLRGESLAASALARLDRWICTRADRNVVMSEGAAAVLAQSRKLPAERVFVIPGWLDLTSIIPTTCGPAWRKEVGLGHDEHVFMFAGTMGHVSRVDVLLDVADKLRGHDRIRLVCVGQGPLKPRMEDELTRRGLKNLMLLPFQPRERVSDMHSAADVMLLTTSAQMGFTSVPSKLITYLAVGKPVICAVPAQADVAALIQGEQLGLVVPPEDPAALADAIQHMSAIERSSLVETGRRARAVALERYSLEGALTRFNKLFADLGDVR